MPTANWGALNEAFYPATGPFTGEPATDVGAEPSLVVPWVGRFGSIEGHSTISVASITYTNLDFGLPNFETPVALVVGGTPPSGAPKVEALTPVVDGPTGQNALDITLSTHLGLVTGVLAIDVILNGAPSPRRLLVRFQGDVVTVVAWEAAAVPAGTVYRFDLLAKRLSLDDMPTPVATVNDILSDTLYVAVGTAVRGVHKASVPGGVWRSRTFVYAAPISFAWGKVKGQIEAGATLRLYADGTLIQTITVTNREPFRVRSLRARRWAVEVESPDRITGLTLAQASEELP